MRSSDSPHKINLWTLVAILLQQVYLYLDQRIKIIQSTSDLASSKPIIRPIRFFVFTLQSLYNKDNVSLTPTCHSVIKSINLKCKNIPTFFPSIKIYNFTFNIVFYLTQSYLSNQSLFLDSLNVLAILVGPGCIVAQQLVSQRPGFDLNLLCWIDLTCPPCDHTSLHQGKIADKDIYKYNG